jgi:SAM-dependent methyltransferase
MIRALEHQSSLLVGTDTTTERTSSEAALPLERRDTATLYMPSVDDDVDSMLDALAWPEPLARGATFIDIGSGKGRVVLLAAKRRFRLVLGVELSPVLHRIAERNVAIAREGRALLAPVQLVLGDATELTVPGGPLIAYLYHPFREPVAAVVVDRLVTSLAAAPRPAAILYVHPTLQQPLTTSVFARGGMFSELAHGLRRTRVYRIGWSVWTNDAWLAANRCVVGA